jgi:predicted DsbA family dithiol-disulfide isomerase
MTLKIRAFVDYVCPYCFIAETPLLEAVEGKDISVEWIPFELHPLPDSTPTPEMLSIEENWEEHVYPTAEKYGVQITLPQVSPQPHTHLAFQGMQYAKQFGIAKAYNLRVFEAYFQEGMDISQIDVLTQLATDIGLNGQEFRTALETEAYKEIHKRALFQSYYEANITAVPTFLIGQYRVSGLVPREKLEEIIDMAIKLDSTD